MEQSLPTGTETVESSQTETAKLGQNDAVYQYTVQALKGATTPEGVALKSIVTKEVKKEVRKRLFDGFKAGQIKLKNPMDDSKLKKYCSGLINNWLKKDPRFN